MTTQKKTGTSRHRRQFLATAGAMALAPAAMAAVSPASSRQRL